MSLVDEFAKKLRKHATPCASWHKVDLHNHSPASSDFRGDRDRAVEEFVERIRETRISIVMFTDHETLPDASFIKSLADKTGALILAGLELNVFVDAFGRPADKVDKNLCFHLLIGFDPNGKNSPSYWVEHLYKQCRTEVRFFGNVKIKGVSASIDEIHKALEESGAFIIPAHLHSGPDAFRSRSIDVIYDDREFLRWASGYFTALDVRNDATAAFFDGTHREAENLHISCIKSSDAHTPGDLGTHSTWVQMQEVTFAELKAALELPSRVSRNKPPVPQSYFVGIHVEGQFIDQMWLTLSPHMNVLIGVKGSGKTSILECLRFCIGSDVPRERQPEVANHLNTILGPAGRVEVLVRRDDGARVLIERRISDGVFRMTFEDDRQIEYETNEAIRFSAAIFGWHEIEHAATDKQIRRLHMDAIAGREDVKQLTEKAKHRALSIRQLHEVATAKYNEYLQLSETVSRQEAMRSGLQQLQEANLIELRDQMSSALSDKELLQRLRAHLHGLPSEIAARTEAILQIEQFKLDTSPPLALVKSSIVADLADITRMTKSFCESAAGLVKTKAEALDGHIKESDVTFDGFASEYRSRLERLPPEVQRLLESHREVLEKTRELPSLKTRLSLLRIEIDEALQKLSEVSEQVAETLDERLALRASKVHAFNAALSEAGVVLAVLPGAARDDEFTSTFNEGAHFREVLQQLRASHSGSQRFHRMLAECYRDLRNDLMCGDRVMFSRADFWRLTSVLEDDDLDIRFAVGKPGEPYSPIDQLSAGQRCTAVFPILLKLKDGPLIVDQPEDNLDNRHIARSVAPILMGDKRDRQIVLTSHNANLVVLSDPECIVVFESEAGHGSIVAAGYLSHRRSLITSHVLDILDGGEKALEMRSKKYGASDQKKNAH